MNTRAALALSFLGSLLVVAGCSSDPETPASSNSISLTMASTVPVGGESYKCQFFAMPAGKHYIVESSHTYTPGSHHMLVFSTDLTSIPAGADQLGDCYEGTAGYMSHVRGVVYGAQVPEGKTTMPAGVGLEVDAGAVVLMQTHYLNATQAELPAHADVTFTFGDESTISQHAGVMFFYDPFIYVPAGNKGAQAQMRCLVPNDVTLLSAVSHYHKRGYTYSAFLDTAADPHATTPFYTSSDWTDPQPLNTSMKIAAGSRIRFDCGYDNSKGTKDYFQGQSAENDEMCMFTGLYYPAMTQADDLCITAPDMFGTGTASCGATLTCAQACPVDSGLENIGPATLAAVDPCWQKCFVQSCAGATTKLLALNACTTAHCKTECATSTSSACTTCAQANCLAEGAACFADSCS